MFAYTISSKYLLFKFHGILIWLQVYNALNKQFNQNISFGINYINIVQFNYLY